MFEVAKEKNLDPVFEQLNLLKNVATDAWVIRYHKQAIVLGNGKSLWRKENHAKSALANHFNSNWHYRNLNDIGFRNGTELAQYLVNTGILKVERL